MKRDEIAVRVPVPKHDHVSAAETTFWIRGCSKDERGAPVHLRVHEDSGRALRDVSLFASHGCCEQAGKRELQDRGAVKGKFRNLAPALPSDDEEERVLTSGSRSELLELLKTYARLFD